MIPIAYEVNFDGLVGPTHTFAGLSHDNRAATNSRGRTSNPKKAALQGLEKMKLLFDLGIRQAVLPPHPRPDIATMRALGFRGNDRNLPAKVFKTAPELLAACCSSSSMWAANCATFTPSIDSVTGKVHITPANLPSHFHRSLESKMHETILRRIFADPVYFHVHPPLPNSSWFSDEGAANQSRFCRSYGEPGCFLFSWGKRIGAENSSPRQSQEACEAVARRHQLFEERVFFAQQNLEAIKQGAFHSDLFSVGNQQLFFYHEGGFLSLDGLQEGVASQCGVDLQLVSVSEDKLPLRVAVETYLFNSQIVTLPDGGMALIAPVEAEHNRHTAALLKELLEDPANPIRELHVVDLGESMQNGGGPACLRLRASLTQDEINAILPKVFFHEQLYKKLIDWINRHFRDQLTLKDLADPLLVDESYAALDELTKLLEFGSLYPFQR